MYDTYWGLKRPLFTPAAARQSLAGSPAHAEALARLDFLRESHAPLGLLLGPAGSGKSTVLAEFAERSVRGGALVALANVAGTDELAVLVSLAIGLQVAADGDAATMARRLVDRLEEIQLEGVPAVVMLDDLDRTSPRVLLLVERLIASGGTSLTVAASCRNQTVTKIGSRLLDVAALRIDLSPWDEEETRSYLSNSLTSAGRQQPAFDDAATRRLFELSGGAPRRVNQLANLALVAGASQKLIQVDEATVDAVQEELSLAR